jgi:sugar/nucleoside kinase (ribokinase family)
MAGVIWGYLQNMPIDEIARIAATLSAMEIETVGVRIGMPESDKEMRNFMEAHPMQQESLPWPCGHITLC